MQSQARPNSRCMTTFASSSNGTSDSVTPESEPPTSTSGGGRGGLAVAVRTDAGRIVDTSLQDEIEKSYLAVRLLYLSFL
jgi:hypothetical protein